MDVDISMISCCECGVPFWITNSFHRKLVDSEKTFYCPNGHAQHFSETENSRLKKTIANLEKELKKKCKPKKLKK